MARITWTIRILLGISLLIGMSACTMLGLNYASLDVQNKPAATPAIALPFDTENAQRTLMQELYGPWPGELPVMASAPRMIDAAYLDGRGTLEEITLTVGLGERARSFPVVLALPNKAETEPVPLIISQTFSSNCSVFPESPVTNRAGKPCTGSEMTGTVGFLATQIFGTYIAKAPVERYFDAGLGYASFAGGDFVPDSNGAAQSVMRSLSPGPQPTSTLMAWAYGFHAAATVFQDDLRVDGDAIGALGHSRYGKAALVAAGWSDVVQTAIAHQSGFGGGSSSRSETGETLLRMANSYPHWLRPNLAQDLENGTDLSLDQHFLLALIAPKPIFLGNGRRDVWSDPNSSFRLALAADTAYKAQGVAGLTTSRMQDFDPNADIAYWLRTGGHSVVSEDIDAFIAFMSAHFPSATPTETALQTSQ